MDATDQGIVKMFGMAGSIEDLNIAPVAISYEWEPCDVLKAAETTALARDGHYDKKPGEDLNSILSGIMQPKGRVHYTMCAPFTEADYAPLRELPLNTYCREVAAVIDRRIREGYRIWPNSRIASDILRNVSEGGYTQQEKAAFEAHLAEVPEELREAVLRMYAAPLR